MKKNLRHLLMGAAASALLAFGLVAAGCSGQSSEPATTQTSPKFPAP